MSEKETAKEVRYKLFEYFSKDHGLILTESEIDDIMTIFDSIKNKTTIDTNAYNSTPYLMYYVHSTYCECGSGNCNDGHGSRVSGFFKTRREAEDWAKEQKDTGYQLGDKRWWRVKESWRLK